MRRKSLFECCNVKGASPGWKRIMSSRPFILRRACFKIENGLSVNPWKDPWLLNLDGKIPRLKEGVETGHWLKVVDLLREDGSE